MYSKELEEIIDAAISDGVITDKDRTVLHKRALSEGVDLDELDIILDSRLAKITNKKDSAQPIPQQNTVKSKYGNVIKCPNCGAEVDRTKAICPVCKYVFTNVEVTSFIKELYKKLEMADGGKLKGSDSSKERATRKVQQKKEIILNTPIPTTKEDILEFLAAAVSNAKLAQKPTGTKVGRGVLALKIGLLVVIITTIIVLISGGTEYGILGFVALLCILGGMAYIESIPEEAEVAQAWKIKCEQIIIKARFAFCDDPQTLEEIEHYAKLIGVK